MISFSELFTILLSLGSLAGVYVALDRRITRLETMEKAKHQIDLNQKATLDHLSVMLHNISDRIVRLETQLKHITEKVDGLS
jgi:uncharacterized coiled-coil protein SlyX